jgi:hypothetical protein
VQLPPPAGPSSSARHLHTQIPHRHHVILRPIARGGTEMVNSGSFHRIFLNSIAQDGRSEHKEECVANAYLFGNIISKRWNTNLVSRSGMFVPRFRLLH